MGLFKKLVKQESDVETLKAERDIKVRWIH